VWHIDVVITHYFDPALCVILCFVICDRSCTLIFRSFTFMCFQSWAGPDRGPRVGEPPFNVDASKVPGGVPKAHNLVIFTPSGLRNSNGDLKWFRPCFKGESRSEVDNSL